MLISRNERHVLQVEHIFHEMDQSRSGEVNYHEFLSAAISAHELGAADEPSLLSAFNMLDCDGDGKAPGTQLQGMKHPAPVGAHLAVL